MHTRALAWPLLVALLTAGCYEQDSTFTLAPDGSCEVAMDLRVPRSIAEKELLRRAAMEDEEEEEDEGAARPTSLTDEQLTAQARQRAKEGVYVGGTVSVDSAVLEDGKLRVRYRVAFPSVRALLLCRSLHQLVTRVTYEKDDKGRLKITQWATKDVAGMLKTARANGVKGSHRIVLPGKILESAWPETKDNATWVAFAPSDDKNYAMLEKLLGEPMVIVAEMGGLSEKDLPLDSDVLHQEKRAERPVRRRPNRGPELPVTDAEPGFVVEAHSVQTVVRYVYPEGKKFEKDPERRGSEREGVQVRAQLHTPRGRHLLETQSPTVSKAVDDKGRAVAIAKNVSYGRHTFDDDDGDLKTSATLTLAFELPEPDAKFIHELRGGVVATTFGAWKSQRIAPLEADAKKAIALDAFPPGATVTVVAVAQQSRQGSVLIRVEGPQDVDQLRCSLGFPGIESMNSYVQESSSQSNAGRTTRTLKVAYHHYGSEAAPNRDALVLTVRVPTDVRRERVKFVLKDIDLY
ncbi:hypothetical protein HQ560_01320 [bacterium]|nr:hypothetical protein [bacterium]